MRSLLASIALFLACVSAQAAPLPDDLQRELAEASFYTRDTAPDAISRKILVHEVKELCDQHKGVTQFSGHPHCDLNAMVALVPQMMEQGFAKRTRESAQRWVDAQTDEDLRGVFRTYTSFKAWRGSRLEQALKHRLDGTRMLRIQAFASVNYAPQPGMWDSVEKLLFGYKTYPIGGQTWQGAYDETVTSATLAFWAGEWGYLIAGPYINNWLATMHPDVYNEIGGTLYDAVNALDAAWGWDKIGYYEQTIGQEWYHVGEPISAEGSSEQYGGDMGSNDFWMDHYEMTGGGQCWPLACDRR